MRFTEKERNANHKGKWTSVGAAADESQRGDRFVGGREKRPSRDVVRRENHETVEEIVLTGNGKKPEEKRGEERILKKREEEKKLC